MPRPTNDGPAPEDILRQEQETQGGPAMSQPATSCGCGILTPAPNVSKLYLCQLHASASDLLAALKMIATCYIEGDPDDKKAICVCPRKGRTGNHSTACNDVQTAIARAEGRP